jgi:hypothetical protein
MAKMVVTNLRIAADDYAIAKARAGEMEMSLNEYFNWLAQQDNIKLDKPKKKKLVSVYEAFADLGKKKIKYEPMGANEDDKIIYGIED